MADTEKNILFNILNDIFTDKRAINEYPEQSLKSNYFMINRRLAIQYPCQAQVFNNNKINQVDVIKFWCDFLNPKNTNTYLPKWIYTPGTVKTKAHNELKKKVSNKQIDNYCNHYGINKKDVNIAISFFGDEMISEILEYNKMLESINNN